MFDVIDSFLSPSYFLKQRYLEWGIESQRINVVENLPSSKSLKFLPLLSRQINSLVVGFFGQVNPWKGLDLLIEAVCLAEESGAVVQLEVNGGEQPDGEIPSSILFNGKYEPHQLAERMSRVDVVAMASNWYENSPMVIQEAFLHGRPVLAPRLGGMAEKIRDGQDGILVDPGSAEAMAEAMQKLAQQPALLAELQNGVQRSLSMQPDSIKRHAQIYRQLMNC